MAITKKILDRWDLPSEAIQKSELNPGRPAQEVGGPADERIPAGCRIRRGFLAFPAHRSRRAAGTCLLPPCRQSALPRIWQ
jgi:hypothetical protein